MSGINGWSPKPLADALGDEANALHELERFVASADRIRLLHTALEQASSDQRVGVESTERVVELARTFVRFSRAEFVGSDNFYETHPPYSLSTGFLRLATQRLERELDTPLRGDAKHALANLRRTWDTAMELPGLANWPRYLKTLNANETDPHAAELFDELKVEWKKKIQDFLYGEGLLMESFQSVQLRRLADELLLDAQRELNDLHRAVGSLVDSEPARSEISGTEAAAQLDALLVELDEVEQAAREWVSEKTAAVDLLMSTDTDLTQSFERAPRRNNAKSLVMVVPHHDDEARAARIAAYFEFLGYDTSLIVMTDSSAGEPQDMDFDTPHDRREFPTLRKNETAKSAEHADFRKVIALNYGDSGMEESPSQHRRRLVAEWQRSPRAVTSALVTALQDLEPDVIIGIEAQAPYGHPDHMTSIEVIKAARRELSRHGHEPTVYMAALDPAQLQSEWQQLGLGELIGPMPELGLKPNAVLEVGMSEIAKERAVMRKAHQSQIASDGPWHDNEHSGRVWLRDVDRNDGYKETSLRIGVYTPPVIAPTPVRAVEPAELVLSRSATLG